jgi:surface protein
MEATLAYKEEVCCSLKKRSDLNSIRALVDAGIQLEARAGTSATENTTNAKEFNEDTAIMYNKVTSSTSRANASNCIREENRSLLHWLYRIRNASCRRGLRISFIQPDFLCVIYGPMLQSATLLRRTNDDIGAAVDQWCFDRAAAEERYGHISDWDVSSVTDMKELFSFKKHFNDDICRWDVSKVADMSRMFYEAESFDQPVGDWDVSKVRNMSHMFCGARSFNRPVGDWDVSNVTNMGWMFSNALTFNQPVNKWDVSSVTDLGCMFYHASAFNQDVGDWDVSNVTDMRAMFYSACAFNRPVGNWDVSNATNLYRMFRFAQCFNQDLTRWKMRHEANAIEMLHGAYAMQRDNKPASLR